MGTVSGKREVKSAMREGEGSEAAMAGSLLWAGEEQ